MDLFALTATLALDTSQYEQGLKDAGDAAEGFGSSSNRTFSGFSRLGTRTLQTVGKVLSGAAKGAVKFGKDVLQTGLNFEETLGGVYSVTGAVDEYNQALLKNRIIEEARASVFTTAQVAEAAYYEGLAGYTVEETVDGLRGIINLAAAADEPMKAVADIVTDVTTAYGDGAKEQEHYADVLVATATSSNTTVRQMGQALKYVGPVAASLNYSIEDTALLLGLLGDQAIKGSQAGTSLRNIFLRLATNAGETDKKMGALGTLMHKLGTEFYDSEGKARPFIDVIRDMRNAWNGLSQAEKDAIAAEEDYVDSDTLISTMQQDIELAETYRQKWAQATKLGDEDAAKEYADIVADIVNQYSELYDLMGMKPTGDGPSSDVAFMRNVLNNYGGIQSDEEKMRIAYQISSLRAVSSFLGMLNISDEKFDDLYENITNAEGAAEEMAEIRLDNLWGDIEMFTSRVDALKTTLFFDMQGPLRGLVQEATKSIDNIINAVDENGLLGGIEQLGKEIANFASSPEVTSFLTDLGASIAPILSSIVTNITPALVTAAKAMGSAFLDGLLQNMPYGIRKMLGIAHEEEDRANAERILGDNSLIGKINKWLAGIDDSAYQNAVAEEKYAYPLKPVGESAEVPIKLPDPEELLASYGQDFENYVRTFDKPYEVPAELPAPEELLAAGYGDGFSEASDQLADSLGAAGEPAGADIRSAIQTALLAPFSILVNATIEGLPQGTTPPEKHARSMFNGTILRGATMFGLNAAGAPLIGGEAGPEAVVGTDSLQTMIQQSTQQAVGGMVGPLLASLESIRNDMPKGEMVMDTGALVGAIKSVMNAALGRTADWRGSGHA